MPFQDGEQAEGKGERVDGGMDGGVQAVQDSSSSSSSGGERSSYGNNLSLLPSRGLPPLPSL